MNRKDAQLLFDQPMTLLVDLPINEQADLSWYFRLTSKLFNYKGYTVNRNTHRELDFPGVETFDTDYDDDLDLAHLYKNFAWRGFLRYCQPIIRNDILKGFAYRGTEPLSPDVTEYMLRFPSIDWVNATLLSGKLQMADSLRDTINRNQTGWVRGIHKEFKKAQSRLYAILYLMDYFPFIVRSYDKDFTHMIDCYTRSPYLLKALVPDVADELIEQLNHDKEFDTPITGCIKCVHLVADTKGTMTLLEYHTEMAEIDTNAFGLQLLPYFQLAAYTTGFAERINDTTNKAATLILDLQKSGETQRQCTLTAPVFYQVYSSSDMLKVSTRAKFKCGLDIEEYVFKYWNLQASINSDRHYSAFSPFSLLGIKELDLAKLSTSVQNTHNEQIKSIFKNAIVTADQETLRKLAIVCDIKPTRPNLKKLLLGLLESRHTSELWGIIEKNKSLFIPAS